MAERLVNSVGGRISLGLWLIAAAAIIVLFVGHGVALHCIVILSSLSSALFAAVACALLLFAAAMGRKWLSTGSIVFMLASLFIPLDVMIYERFNMITIASALPLILLAIGVSHSALKKSRIDEAHNFKEIG